MVRSRAAVLHQGEHCSARAPCAADMGALSQRPAHDSADWQCNGAWALLSAPSASKMQPVGPRVFYAVPRRTERRKAIV
jgi:hypothetical protein